MSETIAPAAPESPAVEATQEPVVTETVTTETPVTPEQPSEPTYKSARELVQAARQGTLRPQSHHSVTQPRAEDGKWTQDAASAASEQPAAGDDASGEAAQPTDAAPEAASVESTTEPQAAPPPAETVRIELPEGHPLRAQGLAHIDAPKEQERAIRSLVNDPVRRAELDTARTEIRTLREQLIQLQARERALSETWDSTLTDPAIAAQIADIRQTYGDEAAETFKRGLRDQIDRKANEHQSELAKQEAERLNDMNARAFASVVEQKIVSTFPTWWTNRSGFGSLVNEAISEYAAVLQMKENAGYQVTADPNEVIRRLTDRFRNDPDVRTRAQALLEQQKKDAEAKAQREAAEQAAKAAAERERQAAQQAAEAARKNPFGRVSTGINHSTQGATPDAPQTARYFVRQTLSRR